MGYGAISNDGFVAACEVQLKKDIEALFGDRDESMPVHPNMVDFIIEKITTLVGVYDEADEGEHVFHESSQTINPSEVLMRYAASLFIGEQLSLPVRVARSPDEADKWIGLLRDCLEYAESPMQRTGRVFEVSEDMRARIDEAERVAYNTSSVGCPNNFSW